MAKTATRATAAKPAQRATAASPAQRAATASSGASKAQQAAQHQGRTETPKDAPRATTTTQPAPDKVPAEARSSVPALADYGSSNLPDFMRDDAGMGKELIGREDIETPRLKLMQGLSPELETYNDLRSGQFFHTAAEFIFEESFLAVPLYMDKRYLLWRPRKAGGGILARADDGIHWSPAEGEFTVKLDPKDGGHEVTWQLAPTVAQSGLANWGTMNPNDPNSPPAATLMYTYVLGFPEHPDLMPAVFTFQRSSIKNGRKLNTKLKTVRTPIFGTVFRFTSYDDNSGGNDFKNVSVTGEGLVEDPAVYRRFKEAHLSFKGSGLSIKDIEGLQDDAEAGAGGQPKDDGDRTGHDKF